MLNLIPPMNYKSSYGFLDKNVDTPHFANDM